MVIVPTKEDGVRYKSYSVAVCCNLWLQSWIIKLVIDFDKHLLWCITEAALSNQALFFQNQSYFHDCILPIYLR